MSDSFQLQAGNYAPDFTLDTDGGGSLTLSEINNKNIILYFYPKDDTPGCTQESLDFAEAIGDFQDAYTAIIGISKDTVESHDKFKAKYNLPFQLGSDAQNSVCEAYGVWAEKSNYGKKYMGIKRTTFLISKNGIIKKIWLNVRVAGHVQDVLTEAKSL